jgi:hypothetical protein
LATQIERGQSDGSIRKTVTDPMAVGLSLWFATAGIIHQAISSYHRHGYRDEILFETGPDIMRSGLSS